jgi:hypothetical protein
MDHSQGPLSADFKQQLDIRLGLSFPVETSSHMRLLDSLFSASENESI